MSKGRRQLLNIERTIADTMELAKYRGATPEDAGNDLEGAGIQEDSYAEWCRKRGTLDHRRSRKIDNWIFN